LIEVKLLLRLRLSFQSRISFKIYVRYHKKNTSTSVDNVFFIFPNHNIQ